MKVILEIEGNQVVKTIDLKKDLDRYIIWSAVNGRPIELINISTYNNELESASIAVAGTTTEDAIKIIEVTAKEYEKELLLSMGSYDRVSMDEALDGVLYRHNHFWVKGNPLEVDYLGFKNPLVYYSKPDGSISKINKNSEILDKPYASTFYFSHPNILFDLSIEKIKLSSAISNLQKRIEEIDIRYENEHPAKEKEGIDKEKRVWVSYLDFKFSIKDNNLHIKLDNKFKANGVFSMILDENGNFLRYNKEVCKLNEITPDIGFVANSRVEALKNYQERVDDVKRALEEIKGYL